MSVATCFQSTRDQEDTSMDMEARYQEIEERLGKMAE